MNPVHLRLRMTDDKPRPLVEYCGLVAGLLSGQSKFLYKARRRDPFRGMFVRKFLVQIRIRTCMC